jgi:nitrate reductase NapE component|tara:strand:+ start:96 stop:260 length:165 start_codon:yes stop_codon:yes gene_type:complete
LTKQPCCTHHRAGGINKEKAMEKETIIVISLTVLALLSLFLVGKYGDKMLQEEK